MLTQEEYMDVLALRRAGLTITETAEAIALGRHRPPRHLRLVGGDSRTVEHRLDVDGDVVVDAPDLARYAVGAVDPPQLDSNPSFDRGAEAILEAGFGAGERQ